VLALNVVEQGTSCSNNIHVNCVIQTPPTMTLAISAADPTYGCQNLNATPATNVDASVGAPTNTITYTVTAGTAPAGLTGYTYTFGVSGMGATSTFTGSNTTDGAKTATFTTAEGAGGTVTGTISAGSFTLDAAHGGQTYSMNITSATQDVSVDALPTIGVFN
jgi:hypothetical protein